jgi:hypothetical protein
MRMPLPRRIKYLERLFLSAMRVVGKIEITQLAAHSLRSDVFDGRRLGAEQKFSLNSSPLQSPCERPISVEFNPDGRKIAVSIFWPSL